MIIRDKLQTLCYKGGVRTPVADFPKALQFLFCELSCKGFSLTCT
jgi:hypothetical protein